ncbi:hypothetical protein BV25DRAFT_1820238 [Artomyces pyxidatus]|uniref:Uncharacterized protein n=1 Tax=Artomyces pyxidatus TaxID=48021 RepID=A0ACB8TF80_9AGAM|nr:hypothetical protein BV25DRAFT_1820238 [Artomyces pyxidatus]
MTTIPGNFVVPVSILRGFVQTPSKTVMPSFETASSSSSPVLASISTASSSHSAPATATQPPVQASPPLPPVLPSASPFTRSLEAENDRLQQALHVVSLELRNTRDEVVKLRSQATEALEQQKADRSRLAVSQTQNASVR